MVITSTLIHAQKNTVAAGGTATGSGGSATYSIGQIDYENLSGTNGNVSQGVQQAYEIYSVSINELSAAFDVQLFPNPTNDYINLSIGAFELHKKWNYTLTDAQGKLIYRENISESIVQINMLPLAPAAYFLNINTENSQIQTFKIIRNH
jgi:hypothetical protein